jgi:hypothetical protein
MIALAAAMPLSGCGQGSRSGDPDTDDGSTDTGIDTLTLPDGGIDPCGTVVHEGNVSITGEASVAALAGVTRIAGNLSIVNSTVATLDELSSLRCVDGLVHIENNKLLTGISGMSNLTRIKGALIIKYHDTQFADVALPALEYIGGEMTLNGLIIWQSPSFPKLAKVGLTLWIQNIDITSLDGFPALTHIGGSLILILNLDLLRIPGLSALTYVGGDLHLLSNMNLENVEALAGLSEINGGLRIASNPKLDLKGLHNIVTVHRQVDLTRLNKVPTNLDGLSALTTINGTQEKDGLLIVGCEGLVSVDGLSNLTSINFGDLILGNNPLLSDIDGLCNLVHLGWRLRIDGNAVLQNLGGLGNLQEFNGDRIVIANNSSLPTCEAWGFVEQMQTLGWSGATIIEGNWDAGVCEDGSACDW